MSESSPVIVVTSGRPLAEAVDSMLRRLAEWARVCISRYADAPATDVHDQFTYTTGWEPLLTRRPDDALLAFLRRQRDRVHQHFRDTDQWRHGYWRMHEVHHGTEHFELFLGMMLRLDPGDDATVDAFVDMAEHLGNWSSDVPDWFDWNRGLFYSMYFGTDGVRDTGDAKLNVADHWRMVNLALIAHDAMDDARYLQLAAAHASRWVNAPN